MHGAHCVVRIQYRRSDSPSTRGMGVFDAYIVQLKTMGPHGAHEETDKMKFREPYREYRRHLLPDGTMPGEQVYEIVVESM